MIQALGVHQHFFGNACSNLFTHKLSYWVSTKKNPEKLFNLCVHQDPYFQSQWIHKIQKTMNTYNRFHMTFMETRVESLHSINSKVSQHLVLLGHQEIFMNKWRKLCIYRILLQFILMFNTKSFCIHWMNINLLVFCCMKIDTIFTSLRKLNLILFIQTNNSLI